MAANQNPIYTLTPINDWGQVTAADTGVTGTGANVVLVHTTGSNGGYVQQLIFQPVSSTASNTTSQAIARVYLNNGSSVGTAANNNLFKEITLPAINVSTTGIQGALGILLGINYQLQAGYCLYVGINAIAANTQWNIQSVAGNY